VSNKKKQSPNANMGVHEQNEQPNPEALPGVPAPWLEKWRKQIDDPKLRQDQEIVQRYPIAPLAQFGGPPWDEGTRMGSNLAESKTAIQRKPGTLGESPEALAARAKCLKSELTKRRLTPSHFAEGAGVDRKTVNKILNAQPIRDYILERIRQILPDLP